MQKGNVIDLVTYRQESSLYEAQASSISEELKTAIQDLINQLRESGPIQKSG